MTRRIVERTFDPKTPLTARREFIAAGRHYSVGDAFDWKRLSISQRRVLQMFEANLVGHEPPPADPVSTSDKQDLAIDSLAQLQEIARTEGAPIKTTKTAQREAIVANREAQSE